MDKIDGIIERVDNVLNRIKQLLENHFLEEVEELLQEKNLFGAFALTYVSKEISVQSRAKALGMVEKKVRERIWRIISTEKKEIAEEVEILSYLHKEIRAEIAWLKMAVYGVKE
jgi:predicted house-cleaning noncanonical NTP pyrophosphatase (MazG superfamily)